MADCVVQMKGKNNFSGNDDVGYKDTIGISYCTFLLVVYIFMVFLILSSFGQFSIGNNYFMS